MANGAKYNPYVFLPFENQIERKGLKTWRVEEMESESFTGKIKCSLTTVTPVIIPDVHEISQNKEGVTKYKVYTYGGDESDHDLPVIPGSAIKGVVRSLYEAMHDCCMSSFDTDRKMIKRTSNRETTFEAGILEKSNEGWTLYGAKHYSIIKYKSSQVLEEGTEIVFETEDCVEKKKLKDGRELVFKSKKAILKDQQNSSHFKKGFVHITREIHGRFENQTVFEKGKLIQAFKDSEMNQVSSLISIINEKSNGKSVTGLDKGLLDFAILSEPINSKKYDFIQLPKIDRWGLLMKADSHLAQKNMITKEDLLDLPVICSRVPQIQEDLSVWLGKSLDHLDIKATYNLMYDAITLVKEDLGYAICLDVIEESDQFCFKPFVPNLEIKSALIWKKNQVQSQAAKAFLEQTKRAEKFSAHNELFKL